MNWWVKSAKRSVQLILNTFLFSFYNCCIYFNFFFLFFDLHSNTNYEFAIGIIISAITTGVKRYKLIIKKKRTHVKMLLLAKSKLISIEVLISKALVDSVIGHNEFFHARKVLKN